MEKHETISAVFDYTSFLGDSCKKRWTFIEIFTSIAPIFSTVWTTQISDSRSPEERLWMNAFSALSVQCSDESNLISLVRLAKKEGIEELQLKMPYALDEEQIAAITEKTLVSISHTDHDELTIRL